MRKFFSPEYFSSCSKLEAKLSVTFSVGVSLVPTFPMDTRHTNTGQCQVPVKMLHRSLVGTRAYVGPTAACSGARMDDRGWSDVRRRHDTGTRRVSVAP